MLGQITPGMSILTLYGLERSVYTRIARLALEEKGVPHTLEPTEIFGPDGVPPAHRARHPFGRIPVLQHGEFLLYETAAITRYVDEAFDGPPLQPATPALRARMQQLIGLLDSYAYRPMVWGVFVEQLRKPAAGLPGDEAVIAQGLKDARAALQAIDGLAGAAAAEGFLLGHAPTLADLHAWPMLRYFSLADPGRAVLQDFPRLAAWLQRFGQRPSVRRTLGPYETSA